MLIILALNDSYTHASLWQRLAKLALNIHQGSIHCIIKKKHFIHINLHSVQTSVNNSDVCAVIRLLSHLWLSVVLNVWMNNVTLTCQLSVISCCMCRRMRPCLWHREALTDLMNWQMKRWGGFVIRKKNSNAVWFTSYYRWEDYRAGKPMS